MDIQTCQTLKTAGKCLSYQFSLFDAVSFFFQSMSWDNSHSWNCHRKLELNANWITEQPSRSLEFLLFLPLCRSLPEHTIKSRPKICRLCAWLCIVWLESLSQSECEKSTRLENRMMSGKIDGKWKEEWKRRWTALSARLRKKANALPIDRHFPLLMIFLFKVSYATWHNGQQLVRPPEVCVWVEYIFHFMFELQNWTSETQKKKIHVKAIPSNNKTRASTGSVGNFSNGTHTLARTR